MQTPSALSDKMIQAAVCMAFCLTVLFGRVRCIGAPPGVTLVISHHTLYDALWGTSLSLYFTVELALLRVFYAPHLQLPTLDSPSTVDGFQYEKASCPRFSVFFVSQHNASFLTNTSFRSWKLRA